ncbi:MAG: hypothetical protein OEV40_16970, partial [Acidimicrobiia bacterium]|nr:hypothetical protein [Acidimicrobiia bacterium]
MSKPTGILLCRWPAWLDRAIDASRRPVSAGNVALTPVVQPGQRVADTHLEYVIMELAELGDRGCEVGVGSAQGVGLAPQLGGVTDDSQLVPPALVPELEVALLP